jgi:hypothetical protein
MEFFFNTIWLIPLYPQGPWREVALNGDFGPVRLAAARFTQPSPEASCPRCGVVGLDLTWQALGGADRNAKVFVHLYDAAGNLVAQHDSIPVLGTRPLPSWHTGETIVDRHGLAVPDDALPPLTLGAGLYDVATGERLRTVDGRDIVEIAVFNR